MNDPITTNHYMVLAALLFSIGLLGVLIRRNAIIILMSLELMLNAANILFVQFSRVHKSYDGHVFVFFVMTVAAAEVAVALAIIIALFRKKTSVDVDRVDAMRG